MKAILEFSLPEEGVEHRLAVGAGRLASVLSQMDNDARAAVKHGHAYKEPNEVLEWVRGEIRQVADLIEG